MAHGKTNMKADILSRKDQVDTMNNNKDVKLFKDELQTRQAMIKTEVIVIRKIQVVKETVLLEKIQRNEIKE